MGTNTAIAWTDHTFNPWWGCTRVSPGCQHCYAEAFAKRTGHQVWGKGAERRFFGDKHWAEPLKWNAAAEKAGRPALVFCASMADVFEDSHPGHHDPLNEHRSRLFALIEDTPHLIWQLLTKRPENVMRMVPGGWICDELAGSPPDSFGAWPENCWIGTTVEDQERANRRVPVLLDIPAPVRFLSCEPLLGPVDLSLGYPFTPDGIGLDWYEYEHAIDWVIVGGESGPGHRPLDLDNASRLVRQAEAVRIPVFFKQVGGHHPTSGGDEIDGRRIKEFPASALRNEAPVAIGGNA